MICRDCSRSIATDLDERSFHNAIALCWVSLDGPHESCQSKVDWLRSFAESMAEHECEYGDNCPTFGSKHGQCVGCKAREALLKSKGE